VSLKIKSELLQQKRGELKTIYDGFPRDESGEVKGITPEQQTEFVQRTDELKAIQDEYTALKKIETTALQNEDELKSLAEPQRGFTFGGPSHPKGGPEEPGTKSLGDCFLESKAYKARLGQDRGFSPDAIKMNSLQVETSGVSIKTLLATTAGFAPFVPRDGTIIYSPQRRPVVSDLIPQVDTTVAGIRYMEETLFTNNAAAVPEGTVKPESAFQFQERFVGLTKIAVSIPATEEQMADAPQLRGLLDNRMTLQLRLEEERELLQGNPSANATEITGFLNKPGVQSIPKATSDDFTAVLQAIIQIENTVGFANVDGGVIHPLDWLKFRTKQDSTGRFIMGDPDRVGPATLWGKTFIPTIAEPQGSILLGDFATYSQLLRREAITFRVGYVGSQFLMNVMTIIAEMRELLVITRPVAFGVVSGSF